MSLSTEASMDSLPLNTVYTLIVPQSVASPRLAQQLGRYSLSMAAEAETDFSEFAFSTDTFQIMEYGKPENFLRLQATVRRDEAELNGIRFQWHGYSLSGDVAVQRAEETFELSTLVWFQDVPYQLEVDFLPWESLRFSGSYGLEGYYLFAQTRSASIDSGRIEEFLGNPFYLHSKNLPLALKKGTMYASVDVAGLVSTDGLMHTRASTARLQNIPFSTITKNNLDLAFAINRNQLSLNRITYQDEYSELNGRGSANLQELLPLKAGASLSLESPDGEERYSSDARIDANSIQGRLEFASAPIERLGIEAVNGNLSGSIGIDGNLPRPDLAIALSLNEGRLNLDPFGLNLAVYYSRDSVEIESPRERAASISKAESFSSNPATGPSTSSRS